MGNSSLVIQNWEEYSVTQKERPGGQITRLQDTLLLEKTNNTKELEFRVLELHDYSFTILLYNRALAKFMRRCQLHLNNSSHPRNGKHPPLHLTVLVLKLDAIILRIAHTLQVLIHSQPEKIGWSRYFTHHGTPRVHPPHQQYYKPAPHKTPPYHEAPLPPSGLKRRDRIHIE